MAIRDRQLTDRIKAAAREFGADLVGIGDPDRWVSAPFSRTPRALMADCTATISLGIHYLDSCIELGGSPDARYPGPSVSNHVASEHCNYAAFRLCKFIESLGYDALFTPSTGWWNYRENADSPRGFSGDITHYYAAAAAGLGEIGWNNLCLSPEFGPRQRFITLVTNAPLVHDPMYDGDPICDRCKLCEKKCPGAVFEKESNGPMSVTIGERTFEFQHKNLWRCACGENFQLDSFMDRPEHTDENVVLRLCEEAAHGDPEKRFTWKMGMCLKWCVPRNKRYMDRSFAPSPRRRRSVTADFSPNGIRMAHALMRTYLREHEISALTVISRADLEKLGIDSRAVLPNCESAVALLQRFAPGADAAMFRSAQRNALWLARKLELELGYDTLIESGIASDAILTHFAVDETQHKVHLILTNIPFETEYINAASVSKAADDGELRVLLEDTAKSHGSELFGIAPVSRLNEAADQLDAYYKDKEYFVSEEQGWGVRATRAIEMKGKPKNPAIVEKALVCRRAEALLDGAKSVIVLGMPFLNGSVKNVGKGPAPKAAHYAVTVHKEMLLQNEETANLLVRVLEQNGYRAVVTSDLDGLGSKAYAWQLPAIRANAVTALCAGMGVMGKNGLVIHEKYGTRVRYVAIVTDAPLQASELAHAEIRCDNCDLCIKGCPAKAMTDTPVELHIENETYRFAALDQLRCDWAARYGLMADEGPKYLGCTNDYPVPEKITRENLVETIRSSDRLQITNFAPIVEHCVLDCPYNKED
ncbi:MAG: hypothetical protein IIY04_04940 [Oscillospiraceae bacterium]|nr:hypothetical protein [Oscillospiraceae bacterium]